MPKPEAEADVKSVNLGEGHKKERRFTVYKPARVERDDQTEGEVEESIWESGVVSILLVLCSCWGGHLHISTYNQVLVVEKMGYSR